MQIDFNIIAILATIIIGTIGSIAGIVIPLHISMRNSIETMQSSMRNSIDAIHEEMADFHKRIEDINVRMAKQDAEFKAFMKAEEEKRTKFLMGK